MTNYDQLLEAFFLKCVKNIQPNQCNVIQKTNDSYELVRFSESKHTL